MKFRYRYYGQSQIQDTAHSTSMQFAPDTLRAPVYFDGILQPSAALHFREAISSLHDVVVSDLKTRPKDRSAYQQWLQENQQSMLNQYMARSENLRAESAGIQKELTQLQQQKGLLLKPFYAARQQYFNDLYRQNRDMWLVLDPVITVHPDQILFECFSRDEASYASLSCSHNVFGQHGDMACGTTNIDYSDALYTEFQKIRDYKQTRFGIQQAGFSVTSGQDEQWQEPEIDLPDSWIRGFLQVSTAMSLPAVQLQLHPMDIHGICLALRRRKEKNGPRSLRFILQPGKPVEVLIEPWNQRLQFARSVFQGDAAQEIRIWGRRRLLTLERLIPVAQSFTVHLLGTGMPSFWVANMPDMAFTLGLSGWTANDWSSGSQLALMAPRTGYGSATMQAVTQALNTQWQLPVAGFSQQHGLPSGEVAAATEALIQSGRAVYDLQKRTVRWRDLVREPLQMDSLRFQSEQEALASQLMSAGLVKDAGQEGSGEHVLWRARVAESTRNPSRWLPVSLTMDADLRIRDAQCGCDYFFRHQLRRGPCEHILALRQQVYCK